MTREARPPEARTGSASTTSPLAKWAAYDAENAIHEADREAIVATEAVRALVAELAPAGSRDLYTACARLGGLLATLGASPTLAAGTIDGAVRALADAGVAFDPSRVAPARASVLEGYVASVRDAARVEACARWEYPACAVPLADGTVAIACGHPDVDPDLLAAWAGRVAGALSKAKVRRIVLSGGERARAEVESAAALVGIEAGPARPDGGPAARHWLRLPWRK